MSKIIRRIPHANGKGMVDIDLTEYRDLVGTYQFLRMDEVQQVPLALRKYTGCKHSRMEHCLGTYYIARMICNSVGMDEATAHAVSTYGLIHDIAHAPLSHVTDNVLAIYGTDHNKKKFEIIKALRDVLPDADAVLAVAEDAESKNPRHAGIVKSIIGADKLDYVPRDGFHCGEDLGNETESIITNAIFKDNQYGIDFSAGSSVISFLNSYWTAHTKIYLHREVEIPRSMFQRALFLYIENLIESKRTEFLDEIFEMDDIDLLSLLRGAGTSKYVMGELKAGRLHTPVMALKLDGYEDFEDTETTVTITSSEAEDICSDTRTAFERSEKVAKSLDIDSDNVIITVSDDIQRLSRKKERGIVLFKGEEQKLAGDLYPAFFQHLTEEAKRHYAVRLLVHPEHAEKAEAKIKGMRHPKSLLFE
ncbi:MAG: HD domain-containing protein [Candidatus Aenigmarchaeota archaeon]|nr:HD domain-containing protein [Candidatus Aenigmarchaeota archaeon]